MLITYLIFHDFGMSIVVLVQITPIQSRLFLFLGNKYQIDGFYKVVFNQYWKKLNHKMSHLFFFFFWKDKMPHFKLSHGTTKCVGPILSTSKLQQNYGTKWCNPLFFQISSLTLKCTYGCGAFLTSTTIFIRRDVVKGEILFINP